MCFFFFFSSRRRHTRCSRDWSSDVCSSDLELDVKPGEVVHVGDNEQADVEAPRRRGMHAIAFERRPKELARVLERERHYRDADATNPDGDIGTTAVRGTVLH